MTISLKCLRPSSWAAVLVVMTTALCNSADRTSFARNSECGFAFPLLTRTRALTPLESFTTPYKAKHSTRFSNFVVLRNEARGLRCDVFQQRCSSKSTHDQFLNDVADGKEVDDLLAFKKIFDREVEFIDIDFGVKGILKIQLSNHTEGSEVRQPPHNWPLIVM
jgi:hypothetical protein